MTRPNSYWRVNGEKQFEFGRALPYLFFFALIAGLFYLLTWGRIDLNPDAATQNYDHKYNLGTGIDTMTVYVYYIEINGEMREVHWNGMTLDHCAFGVVRGDSHATQTNVSNPVEDLEPQRRGR
jgi:hypothetical protein